MSYKIIEMKNINSGKEFFEGKKTSNVYEYYTHHAMPKIRHNKKRRRTYQGIVNQEPVKTIPDPELF